MGKLSYMDCVFLEQVLMYYSVSGIREMKKNPDIYSDDEILEFRSSVQEITNKIIELKEIKLKEGDKNNGICSNWKRIFRLFK